MSTRPISAVGMRAFRYLTEHHDQIVAEEHARYAKECMALGDDILLEMGLNPNDPDLTVIYDDGVVSGVPMAPVADTVVQDILRRTVEKLEAERPPEATPIVVDGTVIPRKKRRAKKPDATEAAA